MTTNKNNLVGTGIALIALVSLALPFSAFAADLDLGGFDTDWVDTGFYDAYDASYDTGGYDTDWTDTGYYDVYDAQDTSYDTDWTDTGYYDVYDAQDSYGNSSYGSSGSSGSGFKMPSFPTSAANQAYRSSYPVFNQNYPKYPNYPQPHKDTPSNTTVNTCTNDSCNYVDNSITDNSIKVTDSFNTVTTKESKSSKKKENRNDCYDYGYNTYNGYGSYNYGNSYDNYGGNYNSNCYTYNAPIAYPPVYKSTPYVSLSAVPYTGLDLGPMGEVLYWAFLVLWCLGAAYLIVVKRVQNKLVSALNGFLFGNTAKTTPSTHAPVAAYAAPAPVNNDGIDAFIQSQIKRS